MAWLLLMRLVLNTFCNRPTALAQEALRASRCDQAGLLLQCCGLLEARRRHGSLPFLCQPMAVMCGTLASNVTIACLVTSHCRFSSQSERQVDTSGCF